MTMSSRVSVSANILKQTMLSDGQGREEDIIYQLLADHPPSSGPSSRGHLL